MPSRHRKSSARPFSTTEKGRRIWLRVLSALLPVFLSLGAPPPVAADPKEKKGKLPEPTVLTYHTDPFALLAAELRHLVEVDMAAARSRSGNDFGFFYRNTAVELVDPRMSAERLNKLLNYGRGPIIDRFDNVRWGRMVDLQKMKPYINRQDFEELQAANITEILAYAAMSRKGVHSEVNIVKDLPPEAHRLAGFSERRQCPGCEKLYHGIPRFYAYAYDLTPAERELRESELAAAPRNKRAAIEQKWKDLVEYRSNAAAADLSKDFKKVQKNLVTAFEFELSEAARKRAESLGQGGCEGGAAGLPGGPYRRPAFALRLIASCGRSTSNALAKALRSDDYGGIDLSTLELRYLADAPGKGGVEYSFSARPSGTAIRTDLSAGLSTVAAGVDDLRTWLTLPPSTFWVNLHPNQPDRIIDPRLGRTNAGRALLEADLQMKRDAGRLLDPKTELGARYWDSLAGTSGTACYSSRMWIVPGEVQVRQDGDSLFILKATLDVKNETEHGRSPAFSCESSDPAADAHNERLERTLVRPQIVKAVNTAPEYAPLRRAFLARIAAQWIRERHDAGRPTSFDTLIASGKPSTSAYDQGWRPKQVFDRFTRSIRNQEYSYQRTVRRGSTTVVQKMTFGGVDFSKVSPVPLTAEQMERRFPGLAQTARSSTAKPAKRPDDTIWFGESVQAPDRGLWTRTGDIIGGVISSRGGVLMVVLVALGAIVFGLGGGARRRRRQET